MSEKQQQKMLLSNMESKSGSTGAISKIIRILKYQKLL